MQQDDMMMDQTQMQQPGSGEAMPGGGEDAGY
jgi:hypothetical protein